MTEPQQSDRGKLKIYLGYAAGVGKTYQMLSEGAALRDQGRDVVIGYFEPHGRKDTIALTESLETIPRRLVEYRGTVFEEMDTEAILERNPEVCLVDEFPHSNLPSDTRSKRWQDVIVLLEKGIDVLTTMNIQHLESLNDHVRHISGIKVRETIPDWVVKQADEVVMVDVTPDALLNRLRRGVVYAPDKAVHALENFFREPTLVALREMAMRQTAHEVDLRQSIPDGLGPGYDIGYDVGYDINTGDLQSSALAASHERLLLHISTEPTTAALIRRARRVADYLQAEVIAVAVQRNRELHGLSLKERERLTQHLEFARNLHIDTRILEGEDTAQTLVDFARANRVTQIFVARPAKTPWSAILGRSLVQKVVQLANDRRVTIAADRTRR